MDFETTVLGGWALSLIALAATAIIAVMLARRLRSAVDTPLDTYPLFLTVISESSLTGDKHEIDLQFDYQPESRRILIVGEGDFAVEFLKGALWASQMGDIETRIDVVTSVGALAVRAPLATSAGPVGVGVGAAFQLAFRQPVARSGISFIAACRTEGPGGAMGQTKQIKIFIASSIVEFEKDRLELMNHIAQLNRGYERRGIRFELVGCENMSNALAASRKQDEYNDEIRECRYVYVLVGERMGGYTEEEFDVALDQFERTGVQPRIYTYFKDLPEGAADGSVAAFMERLDRQLGHFYNVYSDLDSVKLNMIMELMRDPDVGGVVEFEDGRALLNGQDMMSLENVPMYGGNDDLQAMRAELAELEAKCAELKKRVAATMDEDAMMEFSAAAKRKADLADQIHAMEMAVLENMNLIASKASSNEKVDPREREAARLVGEGDYRGANAILKDGQWDKDIDTAAEVEEGMREKARQYVSSRRALASNLKSMGVTEITIPQIEEAYERACEAAGRWQVGIEVFGEYAEFLNGQRSYGKSLEYAKMFVHRLELDAKSDKLDVAKAYSLLGKIYHNNRMDEAAEAAKRQAIGVLQSITDRSPEEELELAYAKASLGTTFWAIKRHLDAKDVLEEAISIMEKSEQTDKGELAKAYNRLGTVSENSGFLREAEAYHKEAARIREELATSGSLSALRQLSISYHNLGYLCANAKRFEEAETWHKKAIGIRERIAEDNPAVGEPSIATTTIQLGKSYRHMGRFEDAERAIVRGLQIRRRWLPMGVGIHPFSIALALEEYGNVIYEAKWAQRYDEASDMFEEALAIREEAATANPNRSEPMLSTICDEYARLLVAMGQTERAGTLFERALSIRRRWFENDPDVHGRMYAQFCQDYAAFLLDRGQAVQAEQHARQAYEIRRGLYAKFPEIYATEYTETNETLAQALETNGKPEEAAELRGTLSEALLGT